MSVFAGIWYNEKYYQEKLSAATRRDGGRRGRRPACGGPHEMPEMAFPAGKDGTMAAFKKGSWQDFVEVRDFIARNYTPYDGDESFLAPPTDRTRRLWDRVSALMKE